MSSARRANITGPAGVIASEARRLQPSSNSRQAGRRSSSSNLNSYHHSLFRSIFHFHLYRLFLQHHYHFPFYR